MSEKCLSLCYAEQPAASLGRMPLTGKQAGMKEKSHRVSSVGQQDLFPFWLSAEGGEVSVKG